jgi:nicotinamidase-related amidase
MQVAKGGLIFEDACPCEFTGNAFGCVPSIAEAHRLKPMLLVIDVLVDFLDPWPETDRVKLVKAIGSLIQACRAAGHPIVWVRQEFEPDLSDAFREVRQEKIPVTIKGTEGCKIIPELIPHAGDCQIIKKRYSAFFGTELEQIILAQGVDTLVLAGVNTHACVRTTAIDAYQRDLEVIIAREAVGSYDRDHEAISLRYMSGKIAFVGSVAEVVLRIRGTDLRG